MRGMQVTVPAGWFSDEQDAGEFNLHPVGLPDQTLFFWKDIAATRNDLVGTPITAISRTAQGLLAWLGTNPDLIATKPRPTMVGRVPMMTLDVRVSTTAKSPFADCPADPCVGFLRDPQHWDGPFAIDRQQVARLYIGTIGPVTDRHNFVVEIDGSWADAHALESFTQRVRPILDSIVIPDVIVDG